MFDQDAFFLFGYLVFFIFTAHDVDLHEKLIFLHYEVWILLVNAIPDVRCIDLIRQLKILGCWQ